MFPPPAAHGICFLWAHLVYSQHSVNMHFSSSEEKRGRTLFVYYPYVRGFSWVFSQPVWQACLGFALKIPICSLQNNFATLETRVCRGPFRTCCVGEKVHGSPLALCRVCQASRVPGFLTCCFLRWLPKAFRALSLSSLHLHSRFCCCSVSMITLCQGSVVLCSLWVTRDGHTAAGAQQSSSQMSLKTAIPASYCSNAGALPGSPEEKNPQDNVAFVLSLLIISKHFGMPL